MNREIKFRAWDKVQKKYLFPYPEGFHLKFVPEGQRPDMRINDVEIEQYTGLHDKNGKEIYEGDIVKFESHFSGDRWIKKYMEIIDFEDGSFNHSLCNVGFMDVASSCEVIGNIQENPELINPELLEQTK